MSLDEAALPGNMTVQCSAAALQGTTTWRRTAACYALVHICKAKARVTLSVKDNQN